MSSEYRPPILGFSDELVIWRDGTVVCGGILGRIDPEVMAQERAERERKDALRAQGIVVLEDHRG